MLFVPPIFMKRGAPPLTLSFFNSSTATGGAPPMPLPTGIQAGDLIVIGNFARNNVGAPLAQDPTTVGANNFIRLVDEVRLNNTRANVWYKIAAGTESGLNPGGTTGGVENNKWALVFRGSRPITSIIPGSLNVDQTDATPATQTVTAASGQSPLVVIAAYRSSANVTTRGFSPAEDAEISPSGLAFIKRKLFNSSPVNETITMSDNGISNTLISFYLQCA